MSNINYVTASQLVGLKPALKSKSQSRYLPSVDGLRALAVLAVLAYHLNLPFAKGGLVGVTVFFVISGYLITGILYAELCERHTIDLPRFWFRRIRRLFPAIVLVITITAIAAWFVNDALLYKLKNDLFPAIFWFTNWWYIFHQQSYFDAIASPSPVLHFWSLSIEEQFYLIWPLVLIVLYQLGAERASLRRICLGLSAASAIAMIAMYDPASDPSRIYYGTDTRAFSLLIGAYLSLLWPAFNKIFEVECNMMSLKKQAILTVAGIVSLAGILLLAGIVPGTSAFWYRGGLVLASVLSAVLIVAITIPKSPLENLFSTKPLVWIGTRSYGIYLWHYPLLLLMNQNNSGATNVIQMVGEVALIFAVSELSFRFVENPIRQGAIGKIYRTWRAGKLKGLLGREAKIAASVSLSIILLSGVALYTVQNSNQGRGLLSSADIEAGTSEGTVLDGTTEGTVLEEQASETTQSAETEIEYEGAKEPLLIGDSVPLGLVDLFHQAYSGGLLDACGNRQISMGQTVFDYYKDRGEAGKNIIIALGTNGSFTTEQLENFISDIGDSRNIFLITIRTNTLSQSATNQIINDVAERHSNVTIIDWASASNGHDDWVGDDGIHLTNAGRKAYMQLITDIVGKRNEIVTARKKANEEAGGAWQAPTDGSMSTEMYNALLLGATPAAQVSRETTGEALP